MKNLNNEVIFFKALSYVNRLRILLLLSEKELCACKISESLNIPQLALS